MTELEELLSKTFQVAINVKGCSMLPLFKQKTDRALLEKLNGELKVMDVAVFLRKDGSFVMHRIVKIKNGVYTFRGDNMKTCEKNVTKDIIVAKAIGRYRGEKFLDFNKSFFYKLYVFFYVRCGFLHKFYLSVKEFFYKAFVKLKIIK